MNNQSGRPEIGQVERVTPFGGEITNFRNPIHRQPAPVAISPTNIVEGLWTSGDNLEPSAGRLSRKDILDIALHRGESREKKAA